jgi:hypothetical protein
MRTDKNYVLASKVDLIGDDEVELAVVLSPQGRKKKMASLLWLVGPACRSDTESVSRPGCCWAG